MRNLIDERSQYIVGIGNANEDDVQIGLYTIAFYEGLPCILRIAKAQECEKVILFLFGLGQCLPANSLFSRYVLWKVFFE